MKYFQFYPDCHFVSGPTTSALYDLSNKRTISFSKEETDILKMWMNRNSFEDTYTKFGKASSDLLERLIENVYGTVYDGPVYSEPYFPVCKWETQGLFEQPPIVKLAYIQVNSKCQEKCSFCGDNNLYFWQGCNSCLKWPNGIKCDENTEETIKNVYKTIDQLIDVDVEKIVFSGGNPLNDWHTIKNFILYIKDKKASINIMINTNGRGLNDEVISFSKEHDISYCFTIFSDKKEDYIKIMNSTELYDEVLVAISKCKAYNLTYSICLLVAPCLENNIESMMSFVKELDGLNIFTTEMFPINGNKRKIKTLPAGKDRIEHLNADEFHFRRKYNTCLAGTIAFSANGRTFPCPMWDSAIGELPNKDLYDTFRSGYVEAIWRFSKLKVPICRECEYKYACSDCSVLEWALHKNTSAHSIYCSHVAERGEWR